MSMKECSKKSPVIAFMYDFDKTLSPRDMQEYTFIPKLGMKAKDFWKEVEKLSKTEKMDKILAYMYLMVRLSEKKSIPIHKEDFEKHGEQLEYFDGVEDWFSRIDTYAKSKGATAEHYIISSGLTEIIRRSSISRFFKMIYACEFYYDENDIARWPKNVVNYTTKTQFVFRINKGVFDISDDLKVNEFVLDEERYVPFSNMIYIGDGMTDVPCMKVVKNGGGHSIAVYNGNRNNALKLIHDGRANYACKANYSENSDLDRYVKEVIDSICANNTVKKKEMKIYRETTEVRKESIDIESHTTILNRS